MSGSARHDLRRVVHTGFLLRASLCVETSSTSQSCTGEVCNRSKHVLTKGIDALAPVSCRAEISQPFDGLNHNQWVECVVFSRTQEC